MGVFPRMHAMVVVDTYGTFFEGTTATLMSNPHRNFMASAFDHKKTQYNFPKVQGLRDISQVQKLER